MPSSLRLSIILVFLLATTALGLIAYNINFPNAPAPVVQVTEKEKAPAPLTRYLVAARPLKPGTLTREDDFRSDPLDSVPTGAIRETTHDRNRLLGSLVRKNLETGTPITSDNVLPR